MEYFSVARAFHPFGCCAVAGGALYRFAKPQSAGFRHHLLLSVSASSLCFLCSRYCYLNSRFRSYLRSAAHCVRHDPGSLTRSKLARTHDVNWLLVVWCSGVIGSLTPLLAGSVCAWRMARRARRLTPELSVSSELSVPLTSGLPSADLTSLRGRAWPSSRLEAGLRMSGHIFAVAI